MYLLHMDASWHLIDIHTTVFDAFVELDCWVGIELCVVELLDGGVGNTCCGGACIKWLWPIGSIVCVFNLCEFVTKVLPN